MLKIAVVLGSQLINYLNKNTNTSRPRPLWSRLRSQKNCLKTGLKDYITGVTYSAKQTKHVI